MQAARGRRVAPDRCQREIGYDCGPQNGAAADTR
jgi:hypothetical protein